MRANATAKPCELKRVLSHVALLSLFRCIQRSAADIWDLDDHDNQGSLEGSHVSFLVNQPWELKFDDRFLGILSRVRSAKQFYLDRFGKKPATDFKQFAIAQFKSGAGGLHRWANRENAMFKDIHLYDQASIAHDPNEAVETKRKVCSAQWSRATSDRTDTANKLFAFCALAMEDPSHDIHMTGHQLRNHANMYRNKALGGDAWSPSEVGALPDCCADALATVMSESLNQCVAPHQQLLNLNPALGKKGGGHRTITKAPVLYRLMCKEHKKVVQTVVMPSSQCPLPVKMTVPKRGPARLMPLFSVLRILKFRCCVGAR